MTLTIKHFFLENLDEDLHRFTISRQTINMLNKRRETIIETKKFRKSQLMQHNSHMNDINRNGHGSHGPEKWLRNVSTLSPPNYTPPAPRRKSIHAHVNQAFEVDTYSNESETPRSRRRQSKITFA